MLKEALEFLAGQSLAASAPVASKWAPTESYSYRKPNGEIEFVHGRPARRQHEARDLLTIVSFADRFNASASIWYSRSSVVALLDDTDRRDTVRISMQASEEIITLRNLESTPVEMSQAEILRLLRTTFHGAVPEELKLVALLRNVKFKLVKDDEVDLQKGKSSIGSKLASEAQFTSAIPENVVLSVPVFTNGFARWRVPVECCLEVLDIEQKFQLFPLPGEVEKATCEAEANICRDIRSLLGDSETPTPVYYGEPK